MKKLHEKKVTAICIANIYNAIGHHNLVPWKLPCDTFFNIQEK